MNLLKVAILAGGLGTRLAEETQFRPKGMVQIGERPILWHIIKYFSSFGLKEFLVALGYKGEMIQSYFDGNTGIDAPGVNIDNIDTGLTTETGGRVKRLAPYLADGTFILTWCDGLADIDVGRLIEFHRSHGKLATVTAVHPPARFGQIRLGKGGLVEGFAEKPVSLEWINGAYFVLEPGVFDFIVGDESSWERDVMPALTHDGQLMAFRHSGFWQCMDTLHEKRVLDDMWRSGRAPWKIWD